TGVNENEAEFAVERGGGCRPMRLRRLPVDGDDVVHRVHQGLPFALADKRGVGKTIGGVFGPRRSDGPVLAAQFSQHVITPLFETAIQASPESPKGQYALEICQIPASRLARKNVRKAHRDRRFSRGDPARYFRSGAGVRGIAGDRAVERELFAVVSVDLGGTGGNRRRNDGRHRADLQPSAEPGRYAGDSG